MIPVNEPLLDGNEKKYLIECIDTGWISSEGPFVKKFENQMADYVGRKYAISVVNGTAALELAAVALGLQKGDEVIMPAFTIISCAMALTKIGVKPVLIDCDKNLCMDVSQIERKITSKTKAIMIVHIYSFSVDIDPILEISKKYNLKVIEDAAQMHGQEYKGRKCGSFGDISTFSFYPNKHITTGEGGMVLCDDKKIAERCFSLRNLCFNEEKRFVHDEIGFNFRMTNIQAAIGVAQLERIDFFLKKKKFIGQKYTDLLKDIECIYLPPVKTETSENNYWVFWILLNDSFSINAIEVMNELKKYNIGTRPFFYPIHKQPVLKRMGLFKGETYPISEKIYEKGFYLPSGMALTEEQMNEVSNILHKVLK